MGNPPSVSLSEKTQALRKCFWTGQTASTAAKERLSRQFQNLEGNAEKLKALIRENVEQARKALDEQYNLIFKML